MSKHIVILQSGYFGHSSLMNRVKTYLDRQLNGNNIIIVTSNVNNLYKSLQGTETCGKRLANFVLEQIKLHNATKISFIGYSFGGIIVRHCIGILESKDVFTKIVPNVYISIATPHLGVCNLSYIKNTFANHTTSGKELCLNDDNKIMVILSNPKNIYMIGLAKFKQLYAFGNLVNDDRVRFDSACICNIDPIEFKNDKNKLINCGIIDRKFDDQCKNEIFNNLITLEWIRKAVNLEGYAFVHHAIVNNGFVKNTIVLDECVDIISA
jgi:hypothetical protein